MNTNGQKQPRNLFFVLFLFTILFVSSNIATSTNGGAALPYIHLNDLFLETIIIGVALIYTVILSRRILIDSVTMILSVRILLVFVPLFYIPAVQYAFGNIIPYIISLAVYIIFTQKKIQIRDIYFWIKCFAGLLIIQSVLLFFLSPVPYANFLYKYYFVSPAGASNFIAALLLPCLILIGMVETKYKKYVWWIIGIAALFLMKSRTALLAIIIIFIIEFFEAIRMNKKYNFNQLIFFIVSLFSLILFAFIFKNDLFSFIYGYSSIFKGTGILDSFTSGRIGLLLSFIDISLDHIFLGNGLNFTFGKAVPHCFLVEIMYVNGILGLIINLLLFISILKKSKGVIWTQWNVALLFAIIAIFIEALFEKVLFTCDLEFLLWTFITCLLNSIKKDDLWKSYEPINI